MCTNRVVWFEEHLFLLYSSRLVPSRFIVRSKEAHKEIYLPSFPSHLCAPQFRSQIPLRHKSNDWVQVWYSSILYLDRMKQFYLNYEEVTQIRIQALENRITFIHNGIEKFFAFVVFHFKRHFNRNLLTHIIVFSEQT